MPGNLAPLWAGWRLNLGNPPGPLMPGGVPGGIPATPVEIPACWCSQPLTLRLQPPFNHAEVTALLDGATARADNNTSIELYRTVYPFSATVDTGCDADLANLAHFTVTYNGEARMLAPRLVINLLPRTDQERQLILGVARGERIVLTGLPDDWPQGTQTLVIAGITNRAGITARTVEWTTTPVLGFTPGIPGPWFRWGSSAWGGTHIRPF